ncbi:DHHA1 domain-containing protein [Streptomyces sp. DSM 44915]|uniref:DHHA1 domain-containing protein n=1 Tax=Streptomyces chisholmiae TaxID=3075540 RepID=A0ABU2JUR6_9ACTN|nr:DHHA1 domain-containing protein [Streptomyces sp. DSM 44915]MDT0268728.1 DHHA1 domain-containing protein [Streptomyces sp. DSM 44915]
MTHLPDRPAIVVPALEHSGKALLVAPISSHLLGRGVQAAQVITRAAKTVGGGGGGTGALASAGGRRPEHLTHALTAATEDATALLGNRQRQWLRGPAQTPLGGPVSPVPGSQDGVHPSRTGRDRRPCRRPGRDRPRMGTQGHWANGCGARLPSVGEVSRVGNGPQPGRGRA